MAYQEFYCNASTGSNLNAGSDSGSPSMSDTAGTGSWTSTTQTYVSTSTSGSVTVGQWISLYTSSTTTPTTIARITSVSGGGGSAWTIVVSNTSYGGTQPSSLTTGSTYKANVGGCFAGGGAVGMPFQLVSYTCTDASGNPPRVNMKNNATYNYTAGCVASNGLTIQGYTSTPGDGGRATWSGPASGTSFVLLTATLDNVRDMIFLNNGSIGTSAGVSLINASIMERCSVSGMKGFGIVINAESCAIECEVYGCNTANTANSAGFEITNGSAIRCISHHNTGSNNSGWFITLTATAGFYLQDCISDSNTLYGYFVSSANTNCQVVFSGCVANKNGSDGLHIAYTGNNESLVVSNSLFVSNTGAGINYSNTPGIPSQPRFINCAFYNNSSQTTGVNASWITGSITLTGDPFVADSTGNFAPNTTSGQGAAVTNTGRGNFTELYSSYTTPTTSYPYVGAVTNLPAASGGILVNPGMSGGMQ